MDITPEWWAQLRDLIARSAALQERSRRSIEASDALHKRLEALFEQTELLCCCNNELMQERSEELHAP